MSIDVMSHIVIWRLYINDHSGENIQSDRDSIHDNPLLN
jgi:hypothetical protein